MATLNPYMGASGVIVNLEGLRRDMRANALEYMARALDQQPISAIAGIINGNGNRYLERIHQWYKAERADPELAALMAQGLRFDASIDATGKDKLDATAPVLLPEKPDAIKAGSLMAQYDALCDALLPVAQAEADAQIKTYDDVVAIATATLAAIPLVR